MNAPGRMTCGLLGALVGLAVASWPRQEPAPTLQEPPAEQKRQEDGSLILKRDSSPPPPPPHALPAGSREERRVQVAVKPKAQGAPGCPPLEPVRLDLSLVRMPDDTRRVVASSPDGAIITGLDVPLLDPPRRQEPRNAIGLTASLGGMVGAFYDRDAGPFRLGVTAGVRTGRDLGLEVQVRAGIRF